MLDQDLKSQLKDRFEPGLSCSQQYQGEELHRTIAGGEPSVSWARDQWAVFIPSSFGQPT